MRRLLLVLALGGCDIVFHIDRLGLGDGDGGIDAPSSRGDAGPCGGVLVGLSGSGGAGLAQVCVTQTDAVHLPAVINTDSPCT
ncbi:MAG TPA: hypothetical protein VIV58_33345, partial [Kofleriaceae bacterium]